MKSTICSSVRRLGKKWPVILSVAALLVGTNIASATQPVAIFSGQVTSAPIVDATNFYNSGTWSISVDPKPFMTANTLAYTNTGTMQSSIGWEFDYGPSQSGSPSTRHWSSLFFNDNNGFISTVSAVTSTGNSLQTTPVGYLLISATNIINKGILAADDYSAMVLSGSNVDVHRSILEILPTASGGSSVNSSNTFTAATGIFDEYWGRGNINRMNTTTIWSGTIAQSPTFNATETCATSLQTSMAFVPTISDSTNLMNAMMSLVLTNMDGSTTNISVVTNTTRQAVFIYIPDTNLISGEVRFSPSTLETNYYQTVSVRLSAPFTNPLTRIASNNWLYLEDQLGSFTNRNLLTNKLVSPYAECSGATLRPANYVLSRTDPGNFATGTRGAGVPANNFLYQSDFTNKNVSSVYAAYSATVGNQALQLSSSYSISNLPGRIRISANNLNLNQTGISASGQIRLQASNLTSSVGAIMDSENLSYNLGSTTGNLNVTNLAPVNVNGYHGTISCWSAIWTNTQSFIITNNYSVSNDIAGGVTNIVATPSPLTNSMIVELYALMVDASALAPVSPVLVQDLVLHSTNMVVSDPMTVVTNLLFDGQSLTLNNRFSLGSILNWTYNLAPTLRYFTNNGILSIPNDAHFGDDAPTNYLVFVNTGEILSDSQTIFADKLQIIGGINETLTGNFHGITQTGLLSGALIFSEGDLQFTAGSLQITQTELESYNALNFNVTGSLSDGGFGSGNLFVCENGFNLLSKPATGDLLGTTFYSVALGNHEVDHSWAGLDRGTNYSGFSNNAAIGVLILLPQDTSMGDPLFVFSGTGASNAMYVGNLDLSNLTTNNFAELQTELEIAPNMVIYYATAKLGFTPPSGTAEQFLDGKTFGGGQLKWVQGYAGQSAKLSAGVVGGSSGVFQLTVLGIPGQSYIVQSSTNLLSWVNIYTNTSPFTFFDPIVPGKPQKFYRTLIGP